MTWIRSLAIKIGGCAAVACLSLFILSSGMIAYGGGPCYDFCANQCTFDPENGSVYGSCIGYFCHCGCVANEDEDDAYCAPYPP